LQAALRVLAPVAVIDRRLLVGRQARAILVAGAAPLEAPARGFDLTGVGEQIAGLERVS